ncbi:unnamed protein product, partial [Effrenium voratum]
MFLICSSGEIVELEDLSLSSRWHQLHAKSELGGFARLTLAKENRDVADALAVVAQTLQVQRHFFGVHGLKDRRGITYQHLSLPWAQLCPRSLGRPLHDGAVLLGDLARQHAPCRLGAIQGNRFQLALRDVSLGPGAGDLHSAVRHAAQDLRAGFGNYFGAQRFGPQQANPQIGAAIVRRDYRRACQLIVAMSQFPDDVARHFAEERFAALRAALPRRAAVERRLLRALEKDPTNFEAALLALPRQMRLLFLRSLSSLIWNRVVSWRFERFGLEVLPGDLVLEGNGLKSRPNESEMSELSEVVLPLPGSKVEVTHMRQLYEE